ncbi:MAG: hypothetical protein ACI4V7_07725 [Succinivibrionaceae bacterium]
MEYSSKKINQLCISDTLLAENKVNIMIVPNELSVETEDLFGLSFRNINKFHYNRVFLLSDCLEKSAVFGFDKSIVIPSKDNVFYQNFKCEPNLLEKFSQIPHVLQNDTVFSFVKVYECLQPFLEHFFKDVNIIPIVNFRLNSKYVINMFKLLDVNTDDLIILPVSLSIGISKLESTHNDVNILANIFADSPCIKASQTFFSKTINIGIMLGKLMHLRHEQYKYRQVGMLGHKLTNVKSFVAIKFTN